MQLTRPGAGRLSRLVPVTVVAAALLFAAYVGPRASRSLLVLAAGAFGLLLLLQSPGLGLVALAALSFTLPLEFGTGSEVAVTAPVFLGSALFAIWLLAALLRRDVRLPRSRTVLPLVLFVASGLLALFAGTVFWDPMVPRPASLILVQLAQWAIFALSAAVFLATGDLAARGRWLRIATFLFLGLATVVVLELYLPPLRRALGWSSPLMANRSLFWAWLGALATGQILYNRSLAAWARIWLLGLLLAAAYVVWFVQRDWISGWLPFTVAVLVVLWLRIWYRNRAAGIFVGLVMVSLAVLIYPTVFLHAGGERELEISWGGRQQLYAATLDLVKDRPILGLGPAAYRHYGFARWLGRGAGGPLWTRPLISSHNNYIDVYAHMGLVGLALFLWFLVALFRLGWSLLPRFRGDFNEGYAHGALGGLVATLAAMMLADWFLPFVYNIGFPGFRTSILAWMFLGGLVALEQISRHPASMDPGSRALSPPVADQRGE